MRVRALNLETRNHLSICKKDQHLILPQYPGYSIYLKVNENFIINQNNKTYDHLHPIDKYKRNLR